MRRSGIESYRLTRRGRRRSIAVALLTGLVAALPTAATTNVQQEARTPRAADIDALLAEHVSADGPGAAVAVYHDGEIVFEQGYGLANLELGVPIEPASVFYTGSVSKQFVAASVLLLALDGTLSLDDDVRTWVPELPDYGTTITIRHLIHHTSGLRDYLTLMGLAGLPLGTFHDDAGVIELIARQKALNFEPGSRFLYSNSGYLLLAVIVGRASGEPLREFAARRIFEPLGMERSHFHDDYQHVIEGRASAYFPGEDGGYRAFLSTFDRVGSGGLYSSVHDLFAWDENFYHRRVGGDALHDLQHQTFTLNDGTEIDYAAGLRVTEYRGQALVEHSGSLGAYRAYLLRLPDQHFSVAILANTTTLPLARLARQVAELYVADQLGPAPAEQTAAGDGDDSVAAERRWSPTHAELMALAGPYWSEELEVRWDVEAVEDGLRVSRPYDTVTFVPLAPGSLRADRVGASIQFDAQGDGTASSFTLDVGRASGIRFVKVSDRD